jgi:ABC-type antimicrobial peptide transport system permease subunit
MRLKFSRFINFIISIRHAPKAIYRFFRFSVWHITTFSLLLIVYLVFKLVTKIFTARIFPNAVRVAALDLINKAYKKVSFMNIKREATINRIDLIDLALRNMVFKKSRSLITVGGMAVGIGSIVFLVSIGYGIQELVTSRVARLDEMKQMLISAQVGSNVKMNDAILTRFQQVQNVSEVQPLIAAVGRVNFNNSVSDMVVYGVTTNFLTQSAIKPSTGKIFESNEISIQSSAGEVAGVETDDAATQPIDSAKNGTDVVFSIYAEKWLKVREKADTNSKIIGYTRRVDASQNGVEISGGLYEIPDDFKRDSLSSESEQWILSEFEIWEKSNCLPTNDDCEDGGYLRKYQNSRNMKAKGYTAAIYMEKQYIEDQPVILPSVLGDSTESGEDIFEGAVLQASDSASESADFIEIASESAAAKPPETKSVQLGAIAKKEAVVNRAMLKVLGVKEDEAVGKVFNTSFVVVGDLLDSKEKVESVAAEYTIVGVTPDDKTPVFYVPFIDLRSLGIINYSQIKVIVKDKADLAAARKQVEALGFSTQSVVDTVDQINKLFSTLRLLLAVVGMVALCVASLGMFNTLTVSLLERTREVGLMKAMGMKSSEVHELFLTESMIMGFFGGLLGLAIGFLSGKFVGLLLSIFSISKGSTYIDIAYIPPAFVAIIIGLSIIVGVATGLYPARHATRISALNALRYE